MNFESIKKPHLTFKRALATNTRLMGVVGVVAYFEDTSKREVVQIYHLDYESYGIDGFHHLIEPKSDELEVLILGVTGGLGGEMRPIDYEAFVFLIKSAYVVDEECLDALVDFEWFEEQFHTLYASLTIEEEAALYGYLSPEISSPEALINYLIMRVVGCDYNATLPLYQAFDMDESFELVTQPQTLIKNSVSFKGRRGEIEVFSAESIVDIGERYALMVSEIEVDRAHMRVVKARKTEALSMSSIEAAFNLNKPEHMVVCHVDDAFFERRFAFDNPEMMKQTYAFGSLYIEFNKDNHHVSENPYFLNGDVYCMYFFSQSGQLIICSLDAENVKTIDGYFTENGVYDKSLFRICEMKMDDPLLLSFINSSYDNLFDFLAMH